jgi:hypothetical protein
MLLPGVGGVDQELRAPLGPGQPGLRDGAGVREGRAGVAERVWIPIW